jgi:heterodisulfide reductase subunit A-like polyferredoxin
VECLNVTFMEFDSEGKLNLETEAGSEHVLDCDVVIFSIGQRAGLAFIPDDAGVGVTRQATIAVNPNTFAATRAGVFAAGDATTGTAFVIEAVAAGHKVAGSIHRYLSGEPLEPKFAPDLPVVKMTHAEVQTRLVRNEIQRTPRVAMPMMSAQARRNNFVEVEKGYSEEQAKAEASRCLACGICSECLSCVYVCGVKAINHDEVERVEEINVGAVILAPGYQAYNAKLSQEFGFGRFPNVVTALQFERLLSASGPTAGHVQRPSDGAKAKKIAFLQCIGSRDQTHDYCSAVCCMYAAKEAIMAKEHEPDTEVHVFMMDMRSFSKGYEEYYHRAQEKYGVQYHRCRVSALQENPTTHNLIVRYTDSEQLPVISDQSTDHCSLITDNFDLVVLSVGMEMSPAVKQLGQDLGIELDSYGFCSTVQFDPLQTSRAGIYAVGPFREPKDIPETVVEASGAAAQSAALLAPARGLLARERTYPPEHDVTGEEPRIGVFVCHCGSNIGGFLNVPDVASYAKTLPRVAHAENMLYTCSQDSIAKITERVKELGLNRVVVASCTPRTHEPLFQDSIRAAGLNPYLFEMANIRNQCSWVHSKDWEGATRKAKEIVRMSVARVSGLEPLHTTSVSIERSALIIGGGAAGMTAALSLADQGYPVHLVERDSQLGGNLRNVFYLADQTDPQKFFRGMIGRVLDNPLITVHLSSELDSTTGFLGNFVSRLSDGTEIKHGVTIVATGGKEYRGDEYEYGKDPRVVTQQQFESLLANSQSVFRIPNFSVVMIQCVGPAEKYCGRLCCSTALKNALKLKTLNPESEITILYKDIRTYGFKERLYTEARRLGVRFVRYDDQKPVVEISNLHASRPTSKDDLFAAIRNPQSTIRVRVNEPILNAELELRPHLLVLSTPMIPAEGSRELASKLKVPVDADGFFLEAHVKLRPVDFASEGLFMAGAAHYPKFIEETMVQAKAAASRAATILSRPSLNAGGAVAVVDPAKCTACLTCVRICPYGVPKIKASFTGVGNIIGAAYIEGAICQGCGICASECPAKAISVMHYSDAQVIAKVGALFEEVTA